MNRHIVASLVGIAAITLVSQALVNQAAAATIAMWTFETSVPLTGGPLAPEVGAGSATGVHATAGTFSNPSGNGSPESWNSNTWAIGDYYQFQASTLGQTGIVFAWDQVRSSGGPGQPSPNTNNFRLQYSTDGTNFTSVTDYLAPFVAWDNILVDASSKFSQDLSSVAALNNQANVYFRLTAIQPPQNSGGQSRVDNVTIGSVPEPASGTLAVCCAVFMSLLGRKNP